MSACTRLDPKCAALVNRGSTPSNTNTSARSTIQRLWFQIFSERKKKEEDFIMPSAILALLRQSGLTPCILDELYVSWIWRPVFTKSFEQSNVERRWVSHGAVRVWDRRWGSDGYRRRNKLWFSAAGFTDGLISCTATRVACEKVLWQRPFFSYV